MNRSLLLITSLFLLGTSQVATAADGKALYEATCIACHGPKGQGAIPGVPDLAKGGRLTKPDAVLAANILNGFQSKGSPMAMPAKGGNPKLTAGDVKALLTYMRALTGVAKTPARPAPAPARTTPTTVAPAPARATPTAVAPAPARTTPTTVARAPARATPTAVAPAPIPAPPPVPATAMAPASASTPAPAPASDIATAPDMAAFARGAKAWANTCARCHGMRDPKDLTDGQWRVATTHMRLRAGLDGQQVRDITAFLQGSN